MEKGRAEISSPSLLHIRTEKGISYGGNQHWYPMKMGRIGGCGPTVASNIFCYLASARKSCRELAPQNAGEKSGMLELMLRVWEFVRPGIFGIHKASILARGAVRFGERYGVKLTPCTLEIPFWRKRRPSQKEVLTFLESAFLRDLPVGFLNLSKGRLTNLDSWHWVTLIGVDTSLKAKMYDQNRTAEISLSEWLVSSRLGGAFVVLEPEK